MKRTCTTAANLSTMTLLAGGANTQVTLNSVRIGAKDSEALATFYQAGLWMPRPTGSLRPGSSDEVKLL